MDDIKVGDTVTIGLGTHDSETEAWIVFPQKDVTHVEDIQKSSSSCTQWKMKTDQRYVERIKVLSVRRGNPLKGKIVEFRETDWGSELVLIDLGNRQRWFQPYLLNCKPMGVTLSKP